MKGGVDKEGMGKGGSGEGNEGGLSEGGSGRRERRPLVHKCWRIMTPLSALADLEKRANADMFAESEPMEEKRGWNPLPALADLEKRANADIFAKPGTMGEERGWESLGRDGRMDDDCNFHQ